MVVIPDSSDNIFLVGMGRSAQDGSAIIAKLDANGDSLWFRHYGGVLGKLYCALPDDAGGIYAGGTSSTDGQNGGYDGYLIHVDEDGEEIEHTVYGGHSTDIFHDMIRTNDSGFAFTGETMSYGNGIQFFLVKTDSTGEEQWSASYGDSLGDVATSIVQTPDGGFAMAGWTYFFGNNGYTADIMLTRVDDEGNELWTRRFGRAITTDLCHDLLLAPDGGFVLACETSDHDNDILIIRTDPDGEEIWRAFYALPTGRFMNCHTIMPDEHGGYYLSGYTYSNIFLVKTEADPVTVPYILDPAYPTTTVLYVPYPNPFNSTINLSFNLPRPTRIKMSIIDDLGREIETIVDGYYQEGRHLTYWHAESIPAGLYIAKMQIGKQNFSRKLMLVK